MRKVNNKAARLLAIILAFILVFTQSIYAFAADPKAKNSQISTNEKGYEYVKKNGAVEYYTQGDSKPASIGKAIATNSTSSPTNTAQKNTVELKTNNPRKSTLKNVTGVSKTRVQQNNTLSTSARISNTTANSSKNEALKKRDQSRPKYVPGELLVKFKNEVAESTMASTYAKYSMKPAKRLQSVKADVVKLPASMDVEKAVQTLKADKNIELVQPNYLYYPADFNPPINDYYSSKLWGLENTGQSILDVPGTNDIDIDISEAWSIENGSTTQTVVGVIDTGIDIRHADLQGRIWTNPGEIPNNGIDDDHNGYVDDVNGWDFFNNDNTVFDFEDGDAHGTHVAGTIAAAMNNNIGIAGVAPNAKIMPLKFLGPNGGSTRDSILAMEYAQKFGVKIVNNSWRGGMYDSLLRFAIANSGMLFVAAAGNEGLDIDSTPVYPAAYDCNNIISVAAIDNNGNLADFSNYGMNSVDVAAPGVSILSTYPKRPALGAAIQSDNGVYKTLFHGFGLETVSTASEKASLMTKALQFFGINASSKILLVQDDDSFVDAGTPSDPYYINCMSDYNTALTTALTSLGYSASNITTRTVFSADNGPDYATLSQYNLVIWFTGNSWGDSTGDQSLTNADLDNLKYYLQNGGKLYLSGKDASWNVEYSELFVKYLHTKFLVECEDAPEQMPAVLGMASTSFAGQRYNLLPTEYFDYIKPSDAIGKVALQYEGDPDDVSYYAYMDGTSMAAPHVSGIAALLFSKGTKDPMQMKNRIMGSTTDLPSLSGYVLTGGLVNAHKAIQGNPDDDIPGVKIKPENIGSLNQDTDLDDVYNVYLQAGQKIMLTLTGDANTDFDLHIYGPNAQTVKSAFGLLVSSENPNTSSEAITFTAQDPGMYFIDVYGFAGVGNYTLTSQIMDRAYEDNDPAITFQGNWRILSDVTNYTGGTAKELVGPGSVILNFEGSRIKWTAFKDSKQGKALVYIDNAYAGEVNLYSSTPSYKQVVFDRAVGFGPHTIEIKWAGMWDRQARKTSTNINVDKLSVSFEKIKPAAPTNLTTAGYVGRVRLEFDYNTAPSTNFFVIYRSEDGTNFNKVNMIYADTNTHYKFYDDGLYGKQYTYKVTAVSNDGIESDPSNTSSATALEPNSVYKIDNASSFVTYTGAWTPESDPNAYKGSRHVTTATGAKVTIPVRAYDTYLDFGYKSGESGTLRITMPNGSTKDISVSGPYGGFGFGYPNQVTGTCAVELVSGTLSFDFATILDIDTTAPSAPTGFTGTLTTGGASLSWPANPEIDVMGYNIYRSTTSGTVGTKITAEPRNVLSVVDNTIEAGTNYYYRITAVDYAGNESGKSNEVAITQQAAQLPGAGTYEETDSRIKKSSGWASVSSTNYSGGASIITPSAGQYIEFSFNGTGIRWIGTKHNNRGIARVIIDGGTPIDVNGYYGSVVYQTTMFEKTDLAPGNHTIRIEVTGTKLSPSIGTNVSFDAFIVTEEQQYVNNTYEETNNRVTKSSGWTSYSDTRYSGGASILAASAGQYIEFSFNGIGIKWVGTKHNNRGIARVIIDGGTPIDVNGYYGSVVYQTTMFEKTDLAPGNHTIRIEVTGTKLSPSTGTNVSFDAFVATELIQE